jgi:hypothetical protein
MHLTQSSFGFPSARLNTHAGGAIEVTLISQLGLGAGDALITNSSARQARHPNFVDALEEPSTCIGATHRQQQDFSALYTFSVGAKGHPFHRHAGARCFTAISGSGGASLRFVSIEDTDLLRGGFAAFVSKLHIVEIPPDALFTVRFCGNVWHQFAALTANDMHPALFAISYHRDEREGVLQSQSPLERAESIAQLTETISSELQAQLATFDFSRQEIARTALSLHAPWQNILIQCSRTRSWLGRLRSRTQALLGQSAFGQSAFGQDNAQQWPVQPQALHADSMLTAQFVNLRVHEDNFVLRLQKRLLPVIATKDLLAYVLKGFVHRAPVGVTRLIRFRNLLVKPLGLRTSSLGCPVSSLTQANGAQQFAGFSVHQVQISAGSSTAAVLLGADDKHLQFRSVVEVRDVGDAFEINLATRVHTLNSFGRLYMALIKRTHQAYVAPAMLGLACSYAVQNLSAVRSNLAASHERNVFVAL